MRLPATFACLVIFILTGCSKSSVEPKKVLTADLRIVNATSGDFFNCTVDPQGTLSDSPGSAGYNFGDIPSGDTTNYHRFSNLYRYSWVQVTMNDKLYYLKPYDYTGETPLNSGKYTYKLTYSAVEDRLYLELIVD